MPPQVSVIFLHKWLHFHNNFQKWSPDSVPALYLYARIFDADKFFSYNNKCQFLLMAQVKLMGDVCIARMKKYMENVPS